MSENWNELMLIIDSRPVKGLWLLDDEVLHWRIDGKEYRIEGSDLSLSILNFMKVLKKRIFQKECKLKSCLTCKNFFMSQMARDMGRGQRGVCNFHAKGVEVCYLCADYLEK